MLKANAQAAAGALRSLSDEQLQASAQLFGQPMRAEQAAEGILIDHVKKHLDSFRATLA